MGALENAAGGAMAPQLAAAAAQAGAPGAAPEGAPPGAGGPPPGGPPPAGPAAAPPGGPPPAGPQGAAPPAGGVRQVDPGAAAVEGQLPANFKEERASPEEQKMYEQAMKALSQVLYHNDKVASAVVDQIQPDDKVGTTTKATLLLFQQLDEKLNMDDAIVAQMAQEVTERLMELAEARHDIQYGDREVQVIMGSVWEGVQEMFGMEQQDAEALVANIGGDGLADLKGQYEGFLNG